MRIDKYLSNAGIGTRSNIKKILKDKRVIVNDEIITKPEYKVSQSDIVYVDDEKITYYDNLYILMNKPAGVISATFDKNHKTVIDLISDFPTKNLFPVGRLDIDTVGLLIITSDGDFAHKLTSPKSEIYKTYFAKFSGVYNENIEKIFYEGINLDGEKTKPAYFKYLGNNECTISICEGKFHQVKRMMKSVNLDVEYLKRIKYGSLLLDDKLQEGQYRILTDKEIKQILD